MHNFSFLILFFLFALFSCNTPRYVNAPEAVNAPSLTKAGQNKLAMYYSSNSGNSNENNINRYNKSKGYDVQGAYAITNHWAVQTSYFFRSELNGGVTQSNRDSSSIRYKRNTGSIGIGYYKKIGKHDNVFQVFAGAGIGNYKINDKGIKDYNLYNRYHHAAISKYYLQPALILSEKNISLGLVSRFSFVHYKNIKTDYTESEQLDYNLTDLQNRVLSFWEPAFILNIGVSSFPALKLEMQAGASATMDNYYYDVKTFNGSIGLIMDFSKLKNK